MQMAHAGGQQHVQRTAQQLRARAARNFFERRVHQLNVANAIDQQHAIGCGLQEGALQQSILRACEKAGRSGCFVGHGKARSWECWRVETEHTLPKLQHAARMAPRRHTLLCLLSCTEGKLS